MTDLDKRTDELLADAAAAKGRHGLAQCHRESKFRDTYEWLLVRSLIEPPTDAELEVLLQKFTGYGKLDFFHFVFAQRFAIPAPEPTMEEVLHNMIVLAKPFFTDSTQIMALEQAQTALATLRAAGHEAMAVKAEAGR